MERFTRESKGDVFFRVHFQGASTCLNMEIMKHMNRPHAVNVADIELYGGVFLCQEIMGFTEMVSADTPTICSHLTNPKKVAEAVEVETAVAAAA